MGALRSLLWSGPLYFKSLVPLLPTFLDIPGVLCYNKVVD